MAVNSKSVTAKSMRYKETPLFLTEVCDFLFTCAELALMSPQRL
jgi:hypothetical protein